MNNYQILKEITDRFLPGHGQGVVSSKASVQISIYLLVLKLISKWLLYVNED